MNTIHRIALALFVTATATAQPPPSVGGAGEFRPRKGPQEELQSVTFLGVSVGAIPAVLTHQLGLPDHIGLVVDHLTPRGPAEDSLKAYDVLTKMDDQWLIDGMQLAVLVRNHHEGDEVTVTYVREGKPGSATIKLGHEMAPKLNDASFGMFGRPPEGADRARVTSMVKSIQGDRVTVDGSGASSFFGNTHLNLVDENGGSVELSVANGKKTVVATGPDGKQIFSGPVDTDEERKALPPETAKDLDRLEHMKGFKLNPDGFNIQPFQAPPPPES